MMLSTISESTYLVGLLVYLRCKVSSLLYQICETIINSEATLTLLGVISSLVFEFDYRGFEPI